MDPVIESVAQLLTETLKRKLLESSNGGITPKRKPDVEQLHLPVDTPAWDRKMYEKISDVETNITTSVDFIVNAVAESLKDVGSIRVKYNQHERKLDNMSYQFAQLRSDYKALQEKVIKEG